MTSEEFWKIITTKPWLDTFDTVYDFFSNDLPADFTEEYDVGEVILETYGHHESANEFEKVLKFIELLQRKHPQLYMEYFKYMDDFLVDFYCFHQKKDEAVKGFKNFLQNPEEDYDQLLIIFKKFIFCQYIDIVDTTVINIHDTIKNSDEFLDGATRELAMAKLYINLENYYNESLATNTFNRVAFIESLVPYDFEIQEEIQTAAENGLLGRLLTKDEIMDKFCRNEAEFTFTLRNYFLKEMKKKNFHFILSGTIWDNVVLFWENQARKNKKNKNPDEYFLASTDALEEHFKDTISHLFLDNPSERFAVLWGSVYIYDFLRSIELISQATYDSFKETSKVLKGRLIAEHMERLWKVDFVHTWTKPDGISETEFREEEKIFKKSIHFKTHKFSEVKSEIAAELENIGELAEYIRQGEKYHDNKFNLPLNRLLDIENKINKKTEKTNQRIDNLNFADDFKKNEPIKREEKVGRNDSCPCGSGKKYKKCCLNK